MLEISQQRILFLLTKLDENFLKNRRNFLYKRNNPQEKQRATNIDHKVEEK